MKKIKISSKISFLISSITSIIFVSYFSYKGFMVYFVQKAMDDTFVGGSTSDITVTLWFAIAGTMALSMLLFFQFMKIKDLKSQRTIQKGIFIGWTIIALAMIIFVPDYIYFIILTIIASWLSNITESPSLNAGLYLNFNPHARFVAKSLNQNTAVKLISIAIQGAKISVNSIPNASKASMLFFSYMVFMQNIGV